MQRRLPSTTRWQPQTTQQTYHSEKNATLPSSNGPRRRDVILELVVYLKPVPLRVRHDQPAVMLIEDHGRGKSKTPLSLQIGHFPAPFDVVRTGRQRQLGPFGK